MMTSVLPALAGVLIGAGLYVAFDICYLSVRRRAPVDPRPARRG